MSANYDRCGGLFSGWRAGVVALLFSVLIGVPSAVAHEECAQSDSTEMWQPIPGVNVTFCAASPEPFEAPQPDGQTVTLHLRGNELFDWHEDTEGYVVVQDTDRAWKYARPRTGKAEMEAIPNAKVGRVNPGALGLKKRNLPARDLIRQRVDQSLKSMRGSTKPPPDHPPTLAEQLQDMTDATVPESGVDADASPAPTGEDPGEPTAPEEPPANPIPISGTITVKNIVILAAFNDHWDTGANTVSASFGRPQSEYNALFNQVGHTVDGAVGSVRDYYLENSYGKVTIDSVVSVWVRLPQTESYYGANGASKDTNWRVMLADAIEMLDAQGFDFSQGDGDGDGWVDCYTVIHSGYGEEAAGTNAADRIWSKQGSLSSVVTKDGVKLYKAHTEPALRGSTGTSIVRIGVICHELGHFFGLPDLYDYAGVYEPVNRWCIMAGGSWNGTSGTRPSHFSAWCKAMLGFVKPTLVSSRTGLSLREVETHPEIHMVRDGLPESEYFLIENRNGIGFDAQTPVATPGKGILIWHVDSSQRNNDSSNTTHPAVKLEEADGNFTVSQTTDPWFSGNASMLAGGFRDQTGNLNTNAMSYQSAHYYQRTNNAANYSYIRASGFSVPGATMTYNLTTLVPSVLTTTSNSANYSVTWAASTDAVRYEIQEGSLGSATSFTEGFEDADVLHENWVVAGAQRRTDRAHQGSNSLILSELHGGVWWNSCQFIETRNAFPLQSNTAVSFYYLCQLGPGNGSLRFQATSDDGTTWRTLWTHGGAYVDTFTLVSISTAQITGAGFTVGENLKFRFVLDSQYVSGWSTYPSYGWAIDTFSISNTSLPAFGGWTTLSDAVTGTSFARTGKPNGSYAYRVRASRDGSTFARWSAPQTVAVLDTTIPEIDVQGLGNPVPSGGAATSVNGTDFGNVATIGLARTQSFTIQNTGYVNLNLSGTPRVLVSGTHAADFVVSSQPATPVAPGASTTFQIAFTPSTAGLRSATVSIANNDLDENPYTFALQGTGVLLSVSSVSHAANNAVDNLDLTVNGTGFGAGFVVFLRKAGNSDVAAFNTTVVSSTQITCRVNAAALEKGYWHVVVRAPNSVETVLTDGFFLAVTPTTLTDTLYSNTFASSTGITLGTGWAVGIPNQISVGGPGAAHTGSNVLATNLTGNYANSTQTINATFPAIATTGRTNIRLNFQRWLGVFVKTTSPVSTDTARIQYSTNNSTWTTLWESSSTASTIDTGWTAQSYTLPAAAENQATLYLRFQLQTDNRDVSFGWNIDALSVQGDRLVTPLPPSITSSPALTAAVGQAYSYTISATDSDTAASSLTFSATGVPPGLSLVNNGNGTATLSGTPTTAGPYSVRVTVADGNYSVHQPFTLTVDAAGYAGWSGGISWGVSSNAPGDDPDGDGASNFLEYAFGMSPAVADAQKLPYAGMETEGEVRYLALFYRKGKSAQGVTYTVQSSTDLSLWETVVLTETPVSEDGTAYWVKVRKPFSGQREFLRLRVAE